MSGRIDKVNYYLDIAEATLERATCLRRCFGYVCKCLECCIFSQSNRRWIIWEKI